MDRERQLSNVAFGGAWSEQIAGNERLAEAMQRIEEAVVGSEDADLRLELRLKEAVSGVSAAHPKGRLLAAAWTKGLGLANPGLRVAELKRISDALRAGVGDRLKA